MKKWKLKTALLLSVLTLSMGSPLVQASETEAQSETTETEAEKETRKGLVKQKGAYYFYNNKGEMVTNKWKTVKGKTYYFGADGKAKTGWYTIKKSGKYKSYYFTSKGVLKKSKTKSIDQSLVKLMDAAIKDSGASKLTGKKALKKIFDYMKSEYKYTRVMDMQFTDGWETEFAKRMLLTKGGSCYHDAAAFALTAKRATGYDVRICIGKAKVFKEEYQSHGWVEIKIGKQWYTFDVNADRNSTYRVGKYYMQKSSKVKKYYKATEKIKVEL